MFIHSILRPTKYANLLHSQIFYWVIKLQPCQRTSYFAYNQKLVILPFAIIVFRNTRVTVMCGVQSLPSQIYVYAIKCV